MPKTSFPGRTTEPQPVLAEREVSVVGRVGCECLTAAVAVVMMLLCLKILILTTNLYHSTDFEVHRNWLAITSHPYSCQGHIVEGNVTHVTTDVCCGTGATEAGAEAGAGDAPLPQSGCPTPASDILHVKWLRDARNWYREGRYSIWTLDYPPLFALFECFLSRVIVPMVQQVLSVPPLSNRADADSLKTELSRMLKLDNTENSSAAVQYFQRVTVLLFSDLPLLLAMTVFMTVLVRKVRIRSTMRWLGRQKAVGATPQLAAKETTTTSQTADEKSAATTNTKTPAGGTAAAAATGLSTEAWVLGSLPPISQPWLSGTACGLLLLIALHPVLLMVDSVHFQYNALLFAFVVFGCGCVLLDHVATAAFVFTSLLLAKHLFLYYSMGLAAWALWTIFRRLRHPNRSLLLRVLDVILLCARCAFAVGLAVTLSLAPFFLSEALYRQELEQTVMSSGARRVGRAASFQVDMDTTLAYLTQPGVAAAVARETVSPMLERMFPFGRGLCHSYWAPNLYVFANVADRAWCKLEERRRRTLAGDSDGEGWTCPSSSTNTRGMVGLKRDGDGDEAASSEFSRRPSHANAARHHTIPQQRPCAAPFCVLSLPLYAASRRLDTERQRQSSLHDYDKTRRGLSSLRVLLWHLYASSGSFFLLGFHVHEKAILTILFPLLLLTLVALAETVEGQRQLRRTMHRVVRTPEQAEAIRLLVSQINSYIGAVRRMRMILGLVTFISIVGVLTVFPLLFQVREMPLKYFLALGHAGCLLIVDTWMSVVPREGLLTPPFR